MAREGNDPKQGPAPPQEGESLGPRRLRTGIVYLLLLALFLVALQRFLSEEAPEATYDEFLFHLRAGHVERVVLGDAYHKGWMHILPGAPPPEARAGAESPGPELEVPAAPSGAGAKVRLSGKDRLGGKLPSHGRFKFIVAAIDDPALKDELVAANAAYGTEFKKKPNEGILAQIGMFLVPFLLMAAVLYLVLRQSGQVGRAALSFGKTRAKLYAEKVNTVTFADVAGCDEAKEELKEVVDFLKSPKKYQRLGGRMPKGILLVGPPGTGKTLLARAVAGESRTPFLSLSGSDFVEMFVGVGAARVRDLFEQAKRRAPCIVFVDELDAVGRHRGAGLGGGHDEREQTLNQLLVEMDGFDTTQGVIFLAATNRPDVLDPALLRPGRFDRQVVIDAPDLKGRREILEVHARDKPLSKDVDLHQIAANTPGFTGADLANVLNEAALLAARRGLEKIGQAEVQEAAERVLAGPERKSRCLSEEERRWSAYHESGHALVAALCKSADPVRKISIIPRGHAVLGYTLNPPAEDRYTITRNELVDRLRVLLAGRAAEKVVFGEVSSGSANDLQRATDMARTMVCRLGMSERLGPVSYGRDRQQVFLGRDFYSEEKTYSEATAREIDAEVKRFVELAGEEAENLLREHRACLDVLAKTLLEREVMQGPEFEELIRRELKREPAWNDKPAAAAAASSERQ